jgi:hypothetical protein
MGIILSRPNWSGADIGPRYSLSTLTIGNTYVRLLIIATYGSNVFYKIYRDPISSHNHFLK